MKPLPFPFRRRRDQLHFSLIELIVVIAIIAILAFLIIAQINSSKCPEQKARIEKAIKECENLLNLDKPERAKEIDDCIKNAQSIITKIPATDTACYNQSFIGTLTTRLATFNQLIDSYITRLEEGDPIIDSLKAHKLHYP